MVCHPEHWVAEQTAELIERFLFVLWKAWERGTVILGCGATELLCARCLREEGASLARVLVEGEHELDPLVYECVAKALSDMAERILAVFGVPLDDEFARLWAGERGGGLRIASEGRGEDDDILFGVKSLDTKVCVLLTAFVGLIML